MNREPTLSNTHNHRNIRSINRAKYHEVTNILTEQQPELENSVEHNFLLLKEINVIILLSSSNS